MYIEIKASPDGSHAYQIGGVLEDGWAVIPDGMALPDTFPYVNIEVAEVTHPTFDGGTVVQLEVTSMTDGEEIPIAVNFPSVWDELDAAYREGVDSL